jgi:hypothetical protein
MSGLLWRTASRATKAHCFPHGGLPRGSASQSKVTLLSGDGVVLPVLPFAGTGGGTGTAGNYTTIGVPGSTRTQARGITDSGQIVGPYDASGQGHGGGGDRIGTGGNVHPAR